MIPNSGDANIRQNASSRGRMDGPTHVNGKQNGRHRARDQGGTYDKVPSNSNGIPSANSSGSVHANGHHSHHHHHRHHHHSHGPSQQQMQQQTESQTPPPTYRITPVLHQAAAINHVHDGLHNMGANGYIKTEVAYNHDKTIQENKAAKTTKTTAFDEMGCTECCSGCSYSHLKDRLKSYLGYFVDEMIKRKTGDLVFSSRPFATNKDKGSTAASFRASSTAGGAKMDRKRLGHRVLLELRMTVMMPHACLFMVFAVAFLTMQQIEHRSELYADAHITIRNQLNLDEQLHEVKTAADMQIFIDEFTSVIQVLNPLNNFYWCPSNKVEEVKPPKYISLIPERIVCKAEDIKSFDDHYVGASQAKKERKEIIKGMQELRSMIESRESSTNSEAVDELAGRSSDGSNQGDRGAGTPAMSSPGNGGCGPKDPFHPCSEDSTSAESKPPESYHRNRPFLSILSSVVPGFLYQVRADPVDCDTEFSKFYNNQPVNPSDKPPLNAPMSDMILRCRSDTSDGKFSTKPHLGAAPILIREQPVFHAFLLDTNAMSSLKDWSWVDDMTTFVRLVQFLYTPGSEFMSVVLVDFYMHSTGSVWAKYSMTSFTDLRALEEFKSWCAFGSIAFAIALKNMFRLMQRVGRQSKAHHKHIKMSKLHTFDVFMYGAVVFFIPARFFGLYMTEGRSPSDLMEPMVKAIYHQSKKGGSGGSDGSADSNEAVTLFVNSLLIALDVIDEFELLKAFAYVIILCLIARMVLHFAVHPRIAIISDTLTGAAVNILHYCLVFGFVFIAFAWLGHWSFGVDKPLFRTVQSAIHTSCRMLIGDWNFEDQWKEERLQLVWYICYTFIIFFLLLNIFLAIMVEGYDKRNRDPEFNAVLLSFPQDAVCVVLHNLLGHYHKWPSQSILLDFLQQHSHVPAPITCDELQTALNVSDEAAQSMVRYYFYILGDQIQPTRLVQKAKKDEETQLELEQVMTVFHETVELNAQSLGCIIRIQALVRGAQRRHRIKPLLQKKRELARIDKIREIEAAQKRLEHTLMTLTNATLLMEQRLTELEQVKTKAEEGIERRLAAGFARVTRVLNLKLEKDVLDREAPTPAHAVQHTPSLPSTPEQAIEEEMVAKRNWWPI